MLSVQKLGLRAVLLLLLLGYGSAGFPQEEEYESPDLMTDCRLILLQTGFEVARIGEYISIEQPGSFQQTLLDLYNAQRKERLRTTGRHWPFTPGGIVGTFLNKLVLLRDHKFSALDENPEEHDFWQELEDVQELGDERDKSFALLVMDWAVGEYAHRQTHQPDVKTLYVPHPNLSEEDQMAEHFYDVLERMVTPVGEVILELEEAIETTQKVYALDDPQTFYGSGLIQSEALYLLFILGQEHFVHRRELSKFAIAFYRYCQNLSLKEQLEMNLIEALRRFTSIHVPLLEVRTTDELLELITSHLYSQSESPPWEASPTAWDESFLPPTPWSPDQDEEGEGDEGETVH